MKSYTNFSPGLLTQTQTGLCNEGVLLYIGLYSFRLACFVISESANYTLQYCSMVQQQSKGSWKYNSQHQYQFYSSES